MIMLKKLKKITNNNMNCNVQIIKDLQIVIYTFFILKKK